MDIDPLCIPKHPQLYCWHCLKPMTLIKSYALIKDKFDTKDYDNIIFTYSCNNHQFIIKYSFIEHKSISYPGYHYIIFSNLELITNIHGGSTWVQPESQYNHKIFKLNNWAAFSDQIDNLIEKISNYVVFH